MMWHDNELRGNPENANETKVLAVTVDRVRSSSNQFATAISKYTVRVGDVCFVAIGQIVGRSYSAVRYQPTACIVINSPTYDRQLREQVRAIWSSSDAERKLLDSLLLDYSTEVLVNGLHLDQFQCGAAMRLLYYFPEESLPLLVKRLGGLDVSRQDTGVWGQHILANGVQVDDFVKAVAWCDRPEIRDALRNILSNTACPKILYVCCYALAKVECNSILSPLLNDRRVVDGITYAVVEDQAQPRLAVRVCDGAADAISRHYSEVDFTMAGQYKDLDRQIDTIRTWIVKSTSEDHER